MRKPDTGDLLLTRGNSTFNNLTCRLTGPAGHQATFYNRWNIVEASKESGRVEMVGWAETQSKMGLSGTEWIVFGWKEQVPQKVRISIQLDLLESTEFERYSSIELPLQVIDVVWNRWLRRRERRGYDAYVFRKLGDLWQNGVICSKTSNRALMRNGLLPAGSGLEYGSPSDTYRWLKTCGRIEVLDHSPKWYDFHGA